MQYFLSIPQITLAKYETLDISHACILYFMKQFASEEQIEKHTEEGKTWYWFSTQYIIDELPMLRINSKRTIQRKINEILETLLLERKVDCNKTYYSFTQAFYEIYRGDTTEVRQKCRTMYDNSDALGATKMSHNHNTNINIPKSENIFIREAFDKFWSIYPRAKEEHRASALAYFSQNNLHIHILNILKATENYAQSTRAQNGYVYNPQKFLQTVYPSYVQGNPEEKTTLPSQKIRDEAAALCEKMAWLSERWDGLDEEVRLATIQSDGEVIVREGVELFTPREHQVIQKAGGIEGVLYSYLTKSTQEQLERLLS